MKRCPTCQTGKSMDEFYRNSKSPDGLRAQCKTCTLSANARYREKHRESVLRKKREAYHRDKHKVAPKQRAYYMANKEAKRAYDIEYNRENRDRIRERSRRYVEKNRESINAYKLEWRRSNINQAIRHRVGSNMRRCLKNGESPPGALRHLPYSLDELTARLSATMPDGYTWDDFAKLHIDHIRPVSSFDVMEIGDAQFVECWALDNLQLLTAQDNLAKHNKWGAS